MSPIRFLQNAIVVAFLAITGSAFLFTMTRVALPVPRPLLLFSYGMMAPYQGDDEWNNALIAEGRLPDGTWQSIDLDRSFPVGRGERTIRERLQGVRFFAKEKVQQAYSAFAVQLLTHERERGATYTAVRLWNDDWPRSPGGYEQLHLPAFTTRTFLTFVQ
ncbi:hypothetical protein HY285_02045 [Candidatus Peregrinibacteria bacterium]|nr:hypothetical protein [Candidatus Peregrinibacteria bacterium]MBI3816307.1 hypothetical protein [Candidatus Peregrinibacteria bacterium]